MSDNKLSLHNNYTTSYKNDYYQKYSDIYQLHTPKLIEQPGLKTYHVKNFRFGTKPLREQSKYNDQYQCKVNNIECNYNIPQKLNLPSKSNVSIDPAETGYIKYLDTMATTNTLDYVNYKSKDRNGISAYDNVTYANWLEITKPLKETFKLEQLVKFTHFKNNYNEGSYPELQLTKLNEFRNLKKTIPHNGFCSEQKDKFRKPIPEVLLDFSRIMDLKVQGLGKPVPEWTTENQMYGSRNRLQKFLNINK